MNNTHISGSGTISGGDYDEISISGSGKVNGNISCTQIKISGSGHINGNVICSGNAVFSGSAEITGDFACDGSTVISGSTAICGSLVSDSAILSGACRTDNSMKIAGTVKSSGALHVGNDLEAESATLSGSMKIGGLLSAEKIKIELGGDCDINSIGCTSIEVMYGTHNIFIKSSKIQLNVGTIECDSAELESTVADCVRGKNIIIGDGCHIRRVEYSSSVTVSKKADVGESVKVSGAQISGTQDE